MWGFLTQVTDLQQVSQLWQISACHCNLRSQQQCHAAGLQAERQHSLRLWDSVSGTEENGNNSAAETPQTGKPMWKILSELRKAVLKFIMKRLHLRGRVGSLYAVQHPAWRWPEASTCTSTAETAGIEQWVCPSILHLLTIYISGILWATDILSI